MIVVFSCFFCTLFLWTPISAATRSAVPQRQVLRCMFEHAGSCSSLGVVEVVGSKGWWDCQGCGHGKVLNRRKHVTWKYIRKDLTNPKNITKQKWFSIQTLRFTDDHENMPNAALCFRAEKFFWRHFCDPQLVSHGRHVMVSRSSLLNRSGGVEMPAALGWPSHSNVYPWLATQPLWAMSKKP